MERLQEQPLSDSHHTQQIQRGITLKETSHLTCTKGNNLTEISKGNNSSN